MNWVWISLGALGGMLYLFTKGFRSVKPISARSKTTSKKGLSPEEQAATSLTSKEVDQMEAAFEKTTDPVLRNALLSEIVASHYRQRSNDQHREKFYDYAGQHIDEASGMLYAIEQKDGEPPERIDAFKMMAIALVEDEQFDEAIAVCRQALSLGLEDGTKTGFEGRISRIEKKKAAE